MIEEAGPVWQKFAQTLSGQEDLIGSDLAIELQDILCDCPKHSDSYSKKVISKDFGNKYDLSQMELIGSGTIAQVYRLGDVCIKIKHPNVEEEVMDAVSSYRNIRNTIPFLPVILKQVCDNFFEGIEEQLDFQKEYDNGKLFKKLIHKNTRPENNLFVIPRMLDKSVECLVMEYEPSQPLVLKGRSHLNKHVLLKALHGIVSIYHIGIYHGLLHADLHYGNYGIRGDLNNLQIVIYDFGHMYDIRNVPFKKRKALLNAFISLDTENFTKYIIEDEYHQKQYLNACDCKNQDKSSIDKNCKYLAKYIIINGVYVDKSIFQTLIATEKMMAASNLLLKIEEDPIQMSPTKYYKTYFPYDDFKVLSNR